MGDNNQQLYLKKKLPHVDGAILEVGSKDYGSTASFRDWYVGCEYVGIDLEPGKNVDQVVDFTQGIGALTPDYFALAICCSVLEHVPRPWIFAENLTKTIRPGGKLFMSVPWVWRYHPYPDDYFRFSPRGVVALFPSFTWSDVCYSSTIENEFVDLQFDALDDADNRWPLAIKTDLGGKRKYLPYLMVNMLGTRIA